MNRLSTSAPDVMGNVVEKTPEGHSILIATAEHAKELTEGLREMDKIECMCFGVDPSNAVESSMDNSDMNFTVMTKDNKVMAIFGGGGGSEPYIWMLGTNQVERYSRDFLRHCRKWVWSLAAHYGSVSNWIHADNLVCIKWLKWCGAVFSGPQLIDGELFRKFIITKYYVRRPSYSDHDGTLSSPRRYSVSGSEAAS